MARFTPEQLTKIAKPHVVAEAERDLEATMATVGPDPYWEYHPMGIALVDREAVRVQYELVFENILPYIVSQTERSRTYGDDYYLVEQKYRFNFEGEESDSYFTAMVTVDDSHVVGERVYNAGPLVAVLDRCFDGSFRKLPGVVELYPRR
jgi:hypothetical protein